MKERTLRFILDSLFFDAMSPEFKKANDILLRIVKMNDRTDGLPHTRLVEIGKAFKANDPKAARAAFDKLKPLIAKGDKDLADGLAEAKSKLTEAMQKAERTKAAAVAAKGAVALFDRFRKAIDGVKAKPSAASKLSAYSDKLKAYGDFSKRVAQIAQMAAAKKDVSKQADMLASACGKGKARADRERAKAEKEYAAAKDRVSVFREMEKIRTRKIAEFAKQKGEVQSLGAALPEGNVVGTENLEERAFSVADKLLPIFEEYRSEINRVFSDLSKDGNADVKGFQRNRDVVISGYERIKKRAAVLSASGNEYEKERMKRIVNLSNKYIKTLGSGSYTQLENFPDDGFKHSDRPFDSEIREICDGMKKAISEIKAAISRPGFWEKLKERSGGNKPDKMFFETQISRSVFDKHFGKISRVARELEEVLGKFKGWYAFVVDNPAVNASPYDIYKNPKRIISSLKDGIKNIIRMGK